ncbi:MAG TPA: hypothetical protein VGQ83_38510 [Polyangia bacterium]|jgi:hypothetical protein
MVKHDPGGGRTVRTRPRGGGRACAAALVALATVSTAPAWAAEATFEAVAATARTDSLAGALEDLLATCDDETDERERRTCEAIARDRRERARARAHLVVLDPPRVTQGKDGARVVTLGGCLFCRQPLMLGGAARLITAAEPPAAPTPPPAATRRRGRRAPPVATPATPAPGAAPALAFPDLARVVLEDPGPAERVAFGAALRRLRAEAVVRLDRPRLWRRGDRTGLAVEVAAFRVIDPCSGKVYVSQPASTLLLPETDNPVCRAATAAAADRSRATVLSDHLTAEDVERTLAPVRQHARACFERFRIRGRVDLTLDVRPDGTVKLVRSSGPLNDTPSADCVRAAAIRLRFPPFRSHTSMHLTYTVMLR